MRVVKSEKLLQTHRWLLIVCVCVCVCVNTYVQRMEQCSVGEKEYSASVGANVTHRFQSRDCPLCA